MAFIQPAKSKLGYGKKWDPINRQDEEIINCPNPNAGSQWETDDGILSPLNITLEIK